MSSRDNADIQMVKARQCAGIRLKSDNAGIRLIEVFPGREGGRGSVDTFTHACLLSKEESRPQKMIEIPDQDGPDKNDNTRDIPVKKTWGFSLD